MRSPSDASSCRPLDQCPSRHRRLLAAAGAARPRSGTEVNGSFGKTWDAVIDFFSSKNIQIKTVDRASGLIVAEPATVASNDAPGLADCGTIMGAPIRATAATWNVLVRGDSTRATVKATVRFTYGGQSEGGLFQQSSPIKDCSSRAVWEKDFEAGVKAAAEAKK